MNLTKLLVLACTAFAMAHGAAQVNDGTLAPLQVPAKTLPVPADVSPRMQRIIAAPRNPAWNILWKTGEEWRAAANAQAAKTLQTLPSMRERQHVSVRPATMDGSSWGSRRPAPGPPISACPRPSSDGGVTP